jgi:hypothetical protein
MLILCGHETVVVLSQYHVLQEQQLKVQQMLIILLAKAEIGAMTLINLFSEIYIIKLRIYCLADGYC